jgi:hypothetical protein
MSNNYYRQLKDKLDTYEKLLHMFQLYTEVTMDNEKVKELLGLVCQWSYAHRSGNGEHTDHQQKQLVEHQYQKIKERVRQS